MQLNQHILHAHMEHREMQFMGLFRIYGESLKLTFKLRIIFSQIALTFILPLALTILAQGYVLLNLIRLKIPAFVLLEILSSVLAIAFALLSTSSVVYSIACFYASREITYRSIVRAIVPKVWKRLVVTLFCAFFAIVVLVVSFGLTFMSNKILDRRGNKLSAIGVCVVIAYAVVILSMVMLWQMASVVSVLEDANVLKAVPKVGRLMRGKLVVAAIVSLNHIVVALAGVCFVWVISINLYDLYRFPTREVWKAVGYGCLCTLFWMAVILIGLVVQTTLYMVCKAYHGENIDLSVFGDRPEVIRLGGSEAATTTMTGVQVQMGTGRS